MPVSGTQTSKTVALAPAIVATQQPVLRRRCACGQHEPSGECEECKRKHSEEKGSGDPLLRRATLRKSAINRVPDSVSVAMQQRGSAMDAGLRSRLESSFRCDLSQVRVHADEPAAQAAAAIDARAFTFGQNIWFGRNEFSPHSSRGFHLLAHEVAHTIQQGTQTPVVQRSLGVGAVDDPAEIAAEHAADAVVHATPIAQLGSDQPVIRRQAAGKFPAVEDLGPDEKRVSLDEHTRYRIKRTEQPIRHTSEEPAPPTVGVCADFAKAWVRVEWCRDRVLGHVDVGVDVTKQLQSIIPSLLQAVATRGDVGSVLKGATVTPFLDVLVVRSGKWQLNLKVEADVGRSSATEERANLNLHTEWFDLSGGVTVTQTSKGPSPTGTVTITIPLEKGAKTFKCKDKQKEWWEQAYFYECTKEKEPAKQEPPAPLSPTDHEIYFCWATPKLNEGKCEPGPLDKGKQSAANSAKAAAANKQELSRLAGDFREGYRVTGVTGYTSPEGPDEPLGKFEGNKTLADERGAKTLEIAKEACFPRRPEICITGGPTGVVPANGGSLPGRPEEYPLLRKAMIHLAPPSQPGQTDAPAKRSDLQLPKDYLQCPRQVIDLAFGNQSSKKQPGPDKDKDNKDRKVDCR